MQREGAGRGPGRAAPGPVRLVSAVREARGVAVVAGRSPSEQGRVFSRILTKPCNCNVFSYVVTLYGQDPGVLSERATRESSVGRGAPRPRGRRPEEAWLPSESEGQQAREGKSRTLVKRRK